MGTTVDVANALKGEVWSHQALPHFSPAMKPSSNAPVHLECDAALARVPALAQLPYHRHISPVGVLYIAPPTTHNTIATFLQAFQASQLRQLEVVLINFDSPIGPSAGRGPRHLALDYIQPSAYFNPQGPLARLSLMPQLESLGITFHSLVQICVLLSENSETPITRTSPSHFLSFVGSQVEVKSLAWKRFFLISLFPSSGLGSLQLSFPITSRFLFRSFLQFMGTRAS